MSKNAIEGSTQFFSILEEFCTNRGTDIVNPGSPRYVAGPHDSVDFYIKSQFLDKIVVHPACRFSLVEYCDETIILSYGVNGGSGLSYLQEQEVGPGELTYMVIEHKLFPSVDSAMVSDFIGAGEIGLSGYSGHQLDDALMLFKPIKRFSISPLMALDFQRICFEIARSCDRGLPFARIRGDGHRPGAQGHHQRRKNTRCQFQRSYRVPRGKDRNFARGHDVDRRRPARGAGDDTPCAC